MLVRDLYKHVSHIDLQLETKIGVFLDAVKSEKDILWMYLNKIYFFYSLIFTNCAYLCIDQSDQVIDKCNFALPK